MKIYKHYGWLLLGTAFLFAGCSIATSKGYVPVNTENEDGNPGSTVNFVENAKGYMLPMTNLLVKLKIQKTKDAVKECQTAKSQCIKTGKDECFLIHKGDTALNITNCIDRSNTKCTGNFNQCASAAANTGDDYRITLSVSPMLIPNPKRLVEFRQKSNILAHDTFSLEIKNGMLSTVNAKADDRTPKVIESLAEIAIETIKFSGGALKPLADPTADCNNKQDIMDNIQGDHQFSIALTDIPDSGKILNIVNSYCTRDQTFTAKIIITAEKLGSDLVSASLPSEEVSGVLVSVPRPYNITATLFIGGEPRSQIQAYMGLPDEGPIFQIPLNRTYFTSVQHDLILENGMLTKYTLDRPSPAEGFVNIPLHILKRMVALPAELIKLKYDGPTQDATEAKALVDAQTQLIDSQQKLEEAREKFEDKKQDEITK